MLTKERVLGTSWAYHRVQEHTTYKARFEILEVSDQGKLGIYVYSRDKGLDFSELDELDLDSLEDLVQRGWIEELNETGKTNRDKDARNLTDLTVIAAILIFFTFGLWTFIPGIKGDHQKPWEAAIGAAFIISALIAVAIRRS